MVFFVAPLPPPIHGFSAINLAMYKLLKDRSSEVVLFNRAPPTVKFLPFHIALKFLTLIFQYFLFFIRMSMKRPSSIYVGLSGGRGQVFDIPFLLMAEMFSVHVFIHHHSYAYINNPNFVSKVIFYLSNNSQHVTLCRRMKESLQEIYDLSAKNVIDLSNSAFEKVDVAYASEKKHGFVIGYLSNITGEKGIFEFFDLIAKLNEDGLTFSAKIAGPVNSSILDDFQRRLSDLCNVSHLGPVYGDAKEEFFSSIDVLVFPTKYLNEAEPVTIIESLKSAVPVVATFRGCIADQLDDSCGLVVHDYSDFVPLAARYISRLKLDSDFRHDQSKGAFARFCNLRKCNAEKLDRLIIDMTGGVS